MFMKKKFINGLLMVAMFVGATSSLVSCKDYDDEKNFNLQEQFTNQNAKLQDLVYQLNGLVNGRIDSLNAEFAKCQINCRYTRYRLDSLLNEYNGLRDKVGGMYTNEQIDSMKRALSQEILNVQNQLANYYTIAQIDSLSLRCLQLEVRYLLSWFQQFGGILRVGISLWLLRPSLHGNHPEKPCHRS